MTKIQLPNIKKNPKKFVLYLALIIIFWKLFGSLIGGVGVILLLGIIEKNLQNGTLSKNKKRGIIVGWSAAIIIVCTVLSIGVGVGFFFLKNANIVPDIEKNYSTPEAFKNYESQKMGISALAYPKDWIYVKGADDFEAIFTSPDTKRSISATMYLAPEGTEVDVKTAVTESANAMKDVPNLTFDKSSVEAKTIYGKEWMIFNVMYEDKTTTLIKRIALVATKKNNNRQYFEMVLASPKANFDADKIVFDKMIESVRFYKISP